MKPIPRHPFTEKICLLLFLLLVAALCGQVSAGSQTDLDLWIGQMLMVGFRGTVLEEDDPFLQQLRSLQIGGTVLFDYDVPSRSSTRNILDRDQVRQLTRTLAANAVKPLLIAIDQEGGRIARLKPARGFPATSSQAGLGALDDEEQTRRNARTIAKTLVELGINVNFAPVLDLALNPDNPVITQLERSYGSEPQRVVRHARWTIEEFHNFGVLSAVKHFPGHGSSREDSHLALPDVSETWKEEELEPFRVLIQQGLPDMVMTAHLFNGKWDSEFPATLSETVITGILRKKLGFEGVIISDDLQMAAITRKYGLEETVELTIRAGVDILLVGNNQTYDETVATKLVGILKSLVDQGRISRQRIEESYRRISRLKERLREPDQAEDKNDRSDGE